MFHIIFISLTFHTHLWRALAKKTRREIKSKLWHVRQGQRPSHALSGFFWVRGRHWHRQSPKKDSCWLTPGREGWNRGVLSSTGIPSAQQLVAKEATGPAKLLGSSIRSHWLPIVRGQKSSLGFYNRHCRGERGMDVARALYTSESRPKPARVAN